MIPVVSFVGSSGSGKTTLIAQVVSRLAQKGYQVGVIKHSSHEIEIDKKGKDSYRFRQAGAAAIALDAPGTLAIIKNQKISSFSEILPLFHDMDIIITEGYKTGEGARIGVFREGTGKPPLFAEDPGLLAVVTDSPRSFAARKIRMHHLLAGEESSPAGTGHGCETPHPYEKTVDEVVELIQKRFL